MKIKLLRNGELKLDPNLVFNGRQAAGDFDRRYAESSLANDRVAAEVIFVVTNGLKDDCMGFAVQRQVAGNCPVHRIAFFNRTRAE